MAKILGVIWMILGAVGLIKPAVLRGYIKRKISRKMRWVVYGFLLVFGILIIGSVIKTPGILAKIAGVAGVIIVVKVIALMMSKASEKLWEWWLRQPLIVFRLQALGLILIGVMLYLA